MGATKGLTHFNNQPIIRATITLSHYNNKKESNGIYRIKNNIIYYIYNYYLPLYPLKNVDFSKSMILVFGQYEE